jgi:hypothetical protein
MNKKAPRQRQVEHDRNALEPTMGGAVRGGAGVAPRTLAWCLALLLQLAGAWAWAQDTIPGSAGTSAAAVRNVVLGILSYARWPVEPAELQVCVVAHTEFADDLLQGATQPSGRRVQVQRVSLDSPTLGTDCNVVYLGAASDVERKRLFAQLAGHPILSISERDDACSVGSMFCLHVHGAQVSFDVNLDSVARSGVRVHPSVLQLAHPEVPRP